MSSATKIENQDVLIHFDDSTFEAVTPYQEDFEDQVHEAQEQLQELRHKQEAVERLKIELEELHRKKDDFMKGRTEVSDKLSRCITALDREAMEAQKRADLYLDTKESFEHQLKIVQALRPEVWSRSELRNELSRSIDKISDAQEQIQKSSHVLEGMKSVPKLKTRSMRGALSSGDEGSFSYWMVRGLAFTLPLMIVGSLALAIQYFLAP